MRGRGGDTEQGGRGVGTWLKYGAREVETQREARRDEGGAGGAGQGEEDASVAWTKSNIANTFAGLYKLDEVCPSHVRVTPPRFHRL